MAQPEQKMQLVRARVTNFGCFRDSGQVPIEDVTALIAENENGKSTFLRALAWWSGDEEFDEDDRWDGADEDAVLELVALDFKMTSGAAAALSEAGMEHIPKQVRLIKSTSGEFHVSDAASGYELIPTVGEPKLGISRDALVAGLQNAPEPPIARELAAELEKAEPDSNAARAVIHKVRNDALPAMPEGAPEQLEPLIAEFEAALANPDELVEPSSAYDVLEPFLPQLIYFDDTVDFVKDSVTYAEVAAAPESHRTMVNLASVAGVDLRALANEPPHARQRKSHKAQATLSENFSSYWHGDPVKVFVQLDESQMTLTVQHKGRTQRPSRRSSGLKWQLGFFVNFRAEIEDDLSGAVLLLDEPGLHLHIKQQPKLLELFDDIARDGCRIVYATHLSHMLPPDKPHRYRPLIADPETTDATVVVPNIMALPSKSDVMQPVRQALGMGIADAIGLGGTNIIAEGWAERYALLAMSQACQSAKRPALSSSTTILPAGGSGKKMLPLAAMAVAEKTKAVVLVDDDKAGNSTIALLEKQLPGGVSSLRTHEQGEVSNRELEDLFDAAFYLQLVNASHADVPAFEDLTADNTDLTKPICDAIKEQFAAAKLGKFQKLRPAMELQRRAELGEVPDDTSLDRFGELFARLNEALANA